ncbi:MAG: DUF721 domain-containing protein [Pseudomonadota bacterium]
MSGKRQDRGAAGKGGAGKGGAGPRKPARRSGGGLAAPAPKKPFKPAGFRHAGTAAAPWLREISARRGFAEPRILTDWDDILGPALAPVCRPVKVTYAGRGFGATLIVLASGARAPEVQMLIPRIIERVNGHYGYRAVSRIKVTQTDRSLEAGAGGSRQSERRASGSPDNGPDSRDMTGPTDPHAAAAAAAVQDPGLSAAIDRLGRARAAREAERDARAAEAAAETNPAAETAAETTPADPAAKTTPAEPAAKTTPADPAATKTPAADAAARHARAAQTAPATGRAARAAPRKGRKA